MRWQWQAKPMKKSPSPSSSPSSSPTASEVWLPTQPPTTTCIDTPGWIDSEGDGCDWYELADVPSCPTYGDMYEGSMGVANDNCCHCRGNGDQTVEVVVGSSPCTGNTAGWVDEDGFGCDWYEMNDQPGCTCMEEVWEWQTITAVIALVIRLQHRNALGVHQDGLICLEMNAAGTRLMTSPVVPTMDIIG